MRSHGTRKVMSCTCCTAKCLFGRRTSSRRNKSNVTL